MIKSIMDKNKIVGIVISIVFIWILLTQISLSEIILVLSKINLNIFALGFCLYLSTYFFRVLRFKILLNNKIGFKKLFSIVCVHNLVNNLLPARTGELSYVYMVKKNGVSTGEGIATLMIARIFDIIAISSLFFVSALFVGNLPVLLLNAVWMIAGVLAILILFLFSLAYKGEKVVKIADKILEKIKLKKFKIVGFLLKKAEETVKNFETIKSKKVILYSFLLSLFVWYCLYSMNYVLLGGMGLDLVIWIVVLGSTFSVISTLLPIQGIAGFGTYEGTWALAFIALGLTKEVAISSGFGVHIILVVYFLITGSFGLIMMKFKK